MKLPLATILLLASTFCALADPTCLTTSCPKGSDKIKKIADCPEEGCTTKEGHEFDQELDKRKNIRSDDQQPVLRSIRSMKDLPDSTNYIECGPREALKDLGEGQKITVVAWALIAKKTTG